MRESLRARLVVWYAAVLTLVVVMYGGAVVYQSWQSMLAGVDAELQRYAQEVSRSLEPVEGGRYDLELPSDAAEYFFRPAPADQRRPYYVIWSPAGEIVDRSDPTLEVAKDGSGMAGARQVWIQAAGGALVLVGRDIGDLHRDQRALMLDVVMAGLATLAVAIVGGWFVAGRALAPIKRISVAARAMSAGDLDARIAVERTETELEQVASALNDAFDRLRFAVDQERRFTADASHELRTPISVLRAEAEWALDRERTPQQYRDAIGVCRRAALRMQDAVERMLALVRAESAAEAPPPGPVAMHTVVADVLQWLKPMAIERGVRLSAAGEPVVVRGDAEQLREALSNIVSNAILYNKPGGCVTVWTRHSGGEGRIEIADTGIGIPAEAIPRVFDRFYRVDKARSRDGGGSGLGLSIARAIITGHGGEISCTSEPGTGSMFVIVLPVVDSRVLSVLS